MGDDGWGPVGSERETAASRGESGLRGELGRRWAELAVGLGFSFGLVWIFSFSSSFLFSLNSKLFEFK